MREIMYHVHHYFNFITPQAENLLLARNFSPYNHSKIGLGQPIAIAMAASKLPPAPYPSSLYMVGANSGNPNPAKLRSTVVAPTALAAKRLYESTMYPCTHWKLIIVPAA